MFQCPASMRERLEGIPVKSTRDFLSDLEESGPSNDEKTEGEADEENIETETDSNVNCQHLNVDNSTRLNVNLDWCTLPDKAVVQKNSAGWCWLGNILGTGEDVAQATRNALQKLESKYFLMLDIALSILK